MEEIKAFFEGLKETLNTPIITAFGTTTILGVIALIIRMCLSAPKNKQISLISADLRQQKEMSGKFITKEQYNNVVGYLVELTYFTKNLTNTIKNEEIREDYKQKAQELEQKLPHEILEIVEEKPQEKKARF